MNSQIQEKKKKSPLVKILQGGTTVLLVISTLLCFFAVVTSALKKDVSLFGYRLFYVVSGSMEPTIPVGALLLVGESDEYKVDDIITFYSEEEQIQGYPNTHRIIDVFEEDGRKSYLTKGDNNNSPDTLPVTEEQIIGKVYLSVDKSFIGGFMEFLSTPMGFFAVILLPSLGLMLVCMKSFAKAMKEEIRKAALASLNEEKAKNEECQEDERKEDDTTE